MKTTDPLEQWKNCRSAMEADDGFADRVMERIGRLPQKTSRQTGGWHISVLWRVRVGVAAAILLGMVVALFQLCLSSGMVLGPISEGY
jgi:anti-sigma-K factor RskA